MMPKLNPLAETAMNRFKQLMKGKINLRHTTLR